MLEIDFQIRSFIDFSSSAGDGRTEEEVNRQGPGGGNEEGVKVKVKFW
jgi:hypothetical protein